LAIKLRLTDPSPPVSVEAWRRLARKRLPDLAWAYVDGGADELITLEENMAAFRRWRLRQRCLAGVTTPKLSTTIARQAVSMPVALAPTGGAGMSHWRGDVAASHAAERAGVRAVHSTAGSYTLEEVAEATEENHWFQLYPFADRGRVGQLIDRAQDAGYTALFVTVDTPVVSKREGERRAGLGQPWSMTPSRVLNMLSRPAWLLDAVRRNRLAAAHYVERNAQMGTTSQAGRPARLSAVNAAIASAEAQNRYMQGDLDWQDLAWMRERWKGPLYVKGVLDADDAARAVDQVGAEGVVVSNHGGRQLDRTLAAADALPAIVERVGDRAEVYLDGGVRRGADVITALCLGARGVFIGRPYLYGLAADGERGVAAVLEIFRSELTTTLTLMGCADVASLDRSWLAAHKA
jgi:isopentenyl diphosphate isomerase/L-lactate dehydrogenase-like FMN-dependent dehydrogenase